jgi:hypothetical protein
MEGDRGRVRDDDRARAALEGAVVGLGGARQLPRAVALQVDHACLYCRSVGFPVGVLACRIGVVAVVDVYVVAAVTVRRDVVGDDHMAPTAVAVVELDHRVPAVFEDLLYLGGDGVFDLTTRIQALCGRLEHPLAQELGAQLHQVLSLQDLQHGFVAACPMIEPHRWGVEAVNGIGRSRERPEVDLTAQQPLVGERDAKARTALEGGIGDGQPTQCDRVGYTRRQAAVGQAESDKPARVHVDVRLLRTEGSVRSWKLSRGKKLRKLNASTLR